MIIDCHGHYTTAPAAHTDWRTAQKDAFAAAGLTPPPYPGIPDDDIRASVEGSQLALMAERGTGLTIFSPRASAMEHHAGDEAVSARWAQVSNDLIARVVALYPDRFAGVCQLPQSPGVPPGRSIPELRRYVLELGFDVIEPGNIVFGSEPIGAVRGIDPQTGHHFDDTRRYIDALDLAPGVRDKVYARRIYPRLAARA